MLTGVPLKKNQSITKIFISQTKSVMWLNDSPLYWKSKKKQKKKKIFLILPSIAFKPAIDDS